MVDPGCRSQVSSVLHRNKLNFWRRSTMSIRSKRRAFSSVIQSGRKNQPNIARRIGDGSGLRHWKQWPLSIFRSGGVGQSNYRAHARASMDHEGEAVGVAVAELSGAAG